MEHLHGRVPDVCVGQPRFAGGEFEQLGHPVGAIPLKEVVGKLLAHHLPHVEYKQLELHVGQRQLIFPHVAQFRASVDEVVCVEMPAGKTGLIAAEQPSVSIKHHRFALRHLRAVVDGGIEHVDIVCFARVQP